jgi:hypothetical protein
VKSAATTLNAPDKSPAPPMPWIARPAMIILEDEAISARKDGTMNMTWNNMKVYYVIRL